MNNTILNLFGSDIQALALFIQALATIMIGLLAWTATHGQNRIAENLRAKNCLSCDMKIFIKKLI